MAVKNLTKSEILYNLQRLEKEDAIFEIMKESVEPYVEEMGWEGIRVNKKYRKELKKRLLELDSQDKH